jgi:high affinity sulfate transporter 1
MATAAQGPSLGGRLASVVPILGWIRTYDRSRLLRPDVLAGLTVAAFSVPESMAYAGLAGLTPEHGLYASMLALLVYAFFGSSRHMSVGTTSALAIMVAGTLGGLAFANPDEYLAAAQLTAVFAGIIAIVCGVLRLGFVVNFISESVLTGFSVGAALFIASSQLSKLFGIEGVQGNFFERVWNVLEHLDDTNGWTLGVGLVSIALLLVLERFYPRLPTSLFVVILAIIVMYVTDLEDRGVEVAGDIPRGLPTPDLPTVDASLLPALLGLAFGCFLLSYVEGVSVARTFAAREHESVDANQELYANGAINVGAGIFQGFPVGGSMSRSAVNSEAGAKTPLAGGFAAILLAIVLLFLTEPFGKLPEATLAAVVLVAIRSLIKIPALQRLWRLSRVEFAAAALTMAGVLVFDLLAGILIGAAFSLLALVWRVSRPSTAVLGRVSGTTQFGDLARHPENESIPGVLIFRVDDEIFYANVEAVKVELLKQVESADPPVRLVVLDLANTPSLDLAGVDMVELLNDELRGSGVVFRLAGATGSVRDILRKAGVTDALGPPDRADTVERVVEEWQAQALAPAGPVGAVERPKADAGER